MRKLFCATLVAGALSSAPSAFAYVIGTGPCGGSHHHDPGMSGIRFGTRPDGNWVFTNTQDTGQTSQLFGAAALSHALGRWHWFSGLATWGMVETATTFYPGVASWFDDGNEQYDMWFETQAQVTSYCGSPAVGCTSFDHNTCFFPGVDSNIIAADMAVANNGTTDIVFQDTMAECFLRGLPFSVEGIALHEAGHAVGLAHSEAAPASMNSTRRNQHNCASRQLQDTIYPDDVQGYFRFHKNYSGTAFNFHGSPWIRDSNGSSVSNVPIILGPNTNFTANFKFFVESDYPGANNVEVGLVWIPDPQTPTGPSGSNNIWVMNCTNCQSFLWTGLNFQGAAGVVQVNFAYSFASSSFPVGAYRLWVIMDPNNKIKEDVAGGSEFDNAFPTNVALARFP